MTRQPCCGNRTPHPTRFQARIGGPRYGGRYPWAHGLFPIGGVAPPCTDPSYARGQGFSPKASPLCHSLRSLGSLGPRGPAGAGFPATDTPCLFTGLSAGPVGHRQPGSFFPRLPAAGEGTRPPTPLSGRTAGASQPRPFRVAQHLALGPPRYGVRSSGGLSASTRLVECGASPHFLRHPASPAAQRMWGHALDPPAPAPTGKRFPSTLPPWPRRVKARAHRNLSKASPIATQHLQERVFLPLTPPPPRATL